MTDPKFAHVLPEAASDVLAACERTQRRIAELINPIHTLVPWMLSDSHGLCVVSEKGVVADLEKSRTSAESSEESRANAEFIVRACNSHDALLAACKALMTRFEHTGEAWMDDPAMVQARAVIAKAEGADPPR